MSYRRIIENSADDARVWAARHESSRRRWERDAKAASTSFEARICHRMALVDAWLRDHHVELALTLDRVANDEEPFSRLTDEGRAARDGDSDV